MTEKTELESKILELDEEIAAHEILVTRATNHARYGAMLEKNPIANLEIPNKLFQLWNAKRSLQKRLCTSVSKHYELLNQSIFGGVAEANDALESRLQKEASRLRNKIKKLRRDGKLAEENKKTNMLVYNNEITPVIFDEEETENLPPENESSERQSQNAALKLKGIAILICIQLCYA